MTDCEGRKPPTQPTSIGSEIELTVLAAAAAAAAAAAVAEVAVDVNDENGSDGGGGGDHYRRPSPMEKKRRAEKCYNF